MSRKSKSAQFVDSGYNISVTGRHVQITDSMKDYAIEKIAKIERFSSRIIDVNVIMDIQKLQQRVEIILKINNITIRSTATSDNMYISIDMAVDKLGAQLRRYKRRLQDHQAKGLKEVDMTVSVVQQGSDEELADINDDIEEQNSRELIDRYRPAKVVSQETMSLKLLDTEEAIMRLELSGDSFLLYRSVEDMQLKLIYKREDGHFAIVEPETASVAPNAR